MFYAFSFFAVVFIDLFKGFKADKLKNVVAIFDKGEKGVYKLDDLGNILMINTESRCGGIKDEWKWRFDASRFVHQRTDGLIKRQNIGSNGI